MKTRTAFFALAALAAIAFATEKAKVADLLKDADKFDGKIVEATGKVADFQQKTSRAGNKYFVFKLKDGDQAVNVYSQGEAKPVLKDGDKVKVTGTYRKEKKVSNFTVKNEIDITKSDKEKEKDNGFKKVD